METATTKQKTFSDRYCSKFSCPPEDFEKHLFLKVVHRRSWVLAELFLFLAPHRLNSDFLILRRIGETVDPRTAGIEAMEIKNDYQRMHDLGFIRRFFKLRISGKRLLGMIDQLWESRSRSSARSASRSDAA